jgi:hypothetical protein
MYEIIDADEHDYLYVILELADMGQMARWDFEQEVYHHNEKIYECIDGHLIEQGLKIASEEMSDKEQIARYIF